MHDVTQYIDAINEILVSYFPYVPTTYEVAVKLEQHSVLIASADTSDSQEITTTNKQRQEALRVIGAVVLSLNASSVFFFQEQRITSRSRSVLILRSVPHTFEVIKSDQSLQNTIRKTVFQQLHYLFISEKYINEGFTLEDLLNNTNIEMFFHRNAQPIDIENTLVYILNSSTQQLITNVNKEQHWFVNYASQVI